VETSNLSYTNNAFIERAREEFLSKTSIEEALDYMKSLQSNLPSDDEGIVGSDGLDWQVRFRAVPLSGNGEFRTRSHNSSQRWYSAKASKYWTSSGDGVRKRTKWAILGDLFSSSWGSKYTSDTYPHEWVEGKGYADVRCPFYKNFLCRYFSPLFLNDEGVRDWTKLAAELGLRRTRKDGILTYTKGATRRQAHDPAVQREIFQARKRMGLVPSGKRSPEAILRRKAKAAKPQEPLIQVVRPLTAREARKKFRPGGKLPFRKFQETYNRPHLVIRANLSTRKVQPSPLVFQAIATIYSKVVITTVRTVDNFPKQEVKELDSLSTPWEYQPNRLTPAEICQQLEDELNEHVQNIGATTYSWYATYRWMQIRLRDLRSQFGLADSTYTSM